MDSSIANRMYNISEYLGDLSEKGKVKAYKKNEHGYAKVVEIKKGCSVWVHHLLNGTLIIDLLISPAAQSKNAEACNSAIRDFSCFFDKNPLKGPWYHADKPDTEHTRYSIEVTHESDQKIFMLLKNIRKFYA